MSFLKPEFQHLISKLTLKYGDYFVENSYKDGRFSILQFVNCNGRHSLPWENPENIDRGASGLILFFIQLYKSNRESKYRKLIDDSIEEVLAYCKLNPTNNYSLYTGRSGFIFVLMEYYVLCKKERLLDECLILISPANGNYLYNNRTSDYLYDGRAGTLLVILHLYYLSREESLSKYITQYVNQILRNIESASQGIYWNCLGEINIRPSCSFGFGAAGIKYALSHVNKLAIGSILGFVIGETNKYIDSCWVDTFGSWGNYRKDIIDNITLQRYLNYYLSDDSCLLGPINDFGWANGSSGVSFSFFSESNMQNARNISYCENVMRMAKAWDCESNSLFNGFSGLGMFYLETDKNLDKSELILIVNQITDQLMDTSVDVNFEGGLMHGYIGNVYFLMHCINDGEKESNILAPFLNYDTSNFRGKIPLVDSYSSLKRNILNKMYPKTIFYGEQAFPEMMKKYIDDIEPAQFSDEPRAFTEYMTRIINSSEKNIIKEYIKDIFSFEKQKNEYLLSEVRSCFEIYLEDILFKNKIMEVLNQDNQDLKNRKLIISKKVKLLGTRWNWNEANDFISSHDFQSQYRNIPVADFKYIMYPTSKMDSQEIIIKNELIELLQQFQKPKSVEDGFEAIKEFIRRLPDEELIKILETLSEISSLKEFNNHLEEVIYSEIRQWIFQGILVEQH